MKKLGLFKLFKRDHSSEVIAVGKEILYQGKPAVIIAKIKSNLEKEHLRYNSYQQYIARLSTGEQVFVQEGDVACPVKTIKTIYHGN